ncbi:phosphatase PAP2 family protein [Bdellovibrio bacteriovorus]|uniref:phosphatase PAP2 family protein n=1 Tax=Bdellovibrio bacteriovorus TaxID=959 RepID=UPI003A8056C1
MWEQLDQQIFLFINSTTANPLFDAFFPWWTDFQKSPWFLFMVLPTILLWLFIKTRMKGVLVLVSAVGVASFADFLSGDLIKPVIERARPLRSDLADLVILRGPEQGGFSFPSSHAVDAFALAAFIGVFYPKARIPLLGLAFLTAYSRVYCGVHFPADVAAGAILGGLLGAVIALIAQQITMKWQRGRS